MPQHSRGDELLARIEKRFGFVPPFFLPAAASPEVLENLWHQTLTAYVDNPLPALFKEKVATYLGRYCAVPYCLMCHTCTLRPLGMSGNEILGFLQMPLASDDQVTTALETLRNRTIADLPADEQLEQALVVLSGEVYLQGRRAAESRDILRRALGDERYNFLILFITYNKMCHQWMEAHPSVSYEQDQRYLSNFTEIASEAPGIQRYFDEDAPRQRVEQARQAEADSRAAEIVTARAREAEELMRRFERRFEEVSGALQAQAASASRAPNDAVAEELQRSLAFAQEMLAIVSHDLRDPLSAIITGATVLVLADPANERTSKAVNSIIRSAQRATRLVGDLLDFSQAKMGGGIPLTHQTADIHDLARQVVDELGTAHPNRTIVLEHHGVGEGMWDADRIVQVLSNLLGNALSHSPEGASVYVTSRAENEHVTIEVRNVNREGPIPAALLPVLFDPFKRGTQRTNARTKSVGLGLYIVDHLVRCHQGTVDVRSDEQRTSFTVVLPRRPSSERHT